MKGETETFSLTQFEVEGRVRHLQFLLFTAGTFERETLRVSGHRGAAWDWGLRYCIRPVSEPGLVDDTVC